MSRHATPDPLTRSNTFPLSTFNWVGLDGSQLLTHMTPIVNYNSQCDYGDIKKAYGNHQNLDVSPDGMLLFGNGDGGGGPTLEMLERLRRVRAIGLENDPKGAELPLVRLGASMGEFFDEVKRTTDNGKRLPVWWGELYLEIHRGTYTSQASTKRGNRKGEILLREVELTATLASVAEPSYQYPHDVGAVWDAGLTAAHSAVLGSAVFVPVPRYTSRKRHRDVRARLRWQVCRVAGCREENPQRSAVDPSRCERDGRTRSKRHVQPVSSSPAIRGSARRHRVLPRLESRFRVDHPSIQTQAGRRRHRDTDRLEGDAVQLSLVGCH